MYDIASNPHKYLNVLYIIQPLNEYYSWKNFVLTPLYGTGRKHLQYCKTAFLDLLNRIGRNPAVPSQNGKTMQMEVKHLNINLFQSYFQPNSNKENRENRNNQIERSNSFTNCKNVCRSSIMMTMIIGFH
jgi:hypothetical protein